MMGGFQLNGMGFGKAFTMLGCLIFYSGIANTVVMKTVRNKYGTKHMENQKVRTLNHSWFGKMFNRQMGQTKK